MTNRNDESLQEAALVEQIESLEAALAGRCDAAALEVCVDRAVAKERAEMADLHREVDKLRAVVESYETGCPGHAGKP